MASALTAPSYRTVANSNHGNGYAAQANGSSMSNLGGPTSTSLASFPPTSRSDLQTSRRPSRSPQPHTGAMAEADRTSDPISYQGDTPSTGISSQHSSLSAVAPRSQNAVVHSPHKLRSQYPRSSTENHVEYILVASFDIDRGPVMEHQYPVAITGDEHMLAELMLPDQAHVRNQDWTMFFLHKDTNTEEEKEEKAAKEARRRRLQRRRDRTKGVIHESDDEDESNGQPDEWDEDDATDSESEGGEGPPLVYVLNLVNTKQDKTVKRGAVVKAMAICTRHPFLHIYKPLLLLALEDYFKSPVPETLAMLFEAVNAMDLSLMPKLSLLERHLLQASGNKDLFVEKFMHMIRMRMARDQNQQPSNQPPDVRGGPPPQAIYRAGTKAAVEGHSQFAAPRDTHEFETKVVYKGIPIPIKVPTAVMTETVGDFSLIKLIQNFSEPHLKSPQPFPLHAHLTTNGPHTHPIIVLVNALLTQKRVIFLGYNMPSGEVAEAVLAACALASGGLLRGFTRHAFPYTDLTKIDRLLKVPGFIAGVTNPAFEHHAEWWDLLCDLPSGRMKISSKIDPASMTEGLVYFQQQNPTFANLVNPTSSSSAAANDVTGDNAFMADVLGGITARHGERVIRARWRDWVLRFTRIAAAFEEAVYGASALYIGSDEFENGTSQVSGHGYVWSDEISKARELAGNVTRIEGWRTTRAYYSFIQDVHQLYRVRPLKGLDLHHLHDRLRTQKLTPQASREIYLTFTNYVHSYDEICLLLSVAPESHAGLFYVALGLFHKDREVRVKTVELLDRILKHEAGQHWGRAMSRCQGLAYQRIKREAEAEAQQVRSRAKAGAG